MTRQLILSLLACMAVSANAESPPKVMLDSGIIVGESADGVHYFRGVPYAKPPVGELRWQAPQSIKWQGERDATEFAAPCAQPTNPDGKTRNGGGVWGNTSEDCLYLNVVAPPLAKNAPVMVWLHGGASFLGAGSLGSYNAPAFAQDGVIMVTVNYRLGPAGYFAHPSLVKSVSGSDSVGNYALQDAVASLEWVKRNIKQFGGDPDNVTVFGQSAGGFMVVNLLGIPSAKGLFAKAGIQSGAALRDGLSLDDAQQRASEWATKMGLDGANASLAQLRSIPAAKFSQNRDTARSLGSPIDGKFKTQSTLNAFKNGSANYVPLIIGSNNGEGGFNGARAVATEMSKKAPVFLYNFAYVPEWRKESQPMGAPHSAEIVYVFDSWDTTTLNIEGGVEAIDRTVAKRVHSCWVAFAKASPTATSLNCADGFSWPAFSEKSDDAARFEAAPSLVKASTIPNGPPRGAPRGSMAPN
ncbi:carboxylesterase/lipase family protein [Aurantivibrio plasticivorans]